MLRGEDAVDPSEELMFDEAERKKFDALAQGFLTDDVSDLPKRLEATINDYHNKNAVLLINNAEKMSTAADELETVLGMLSSAVSAASEVTQKEAEVYRQLQSIDSNRDKDAAVVNHQKEVKKKLEEVYEAARIPDELRMNLNLKVPLGDVPYLDTLYKMLEQATRDRFAKEPPKILEGLYVAERRIEELDKLLTVFKNEFTRFMQTKLGDVEACKAWVTLQEKLIKSADPETRAMLKKIPGIDKESLVYVPSLDSKAEKKKFSENLESHMVIRSIFPYWKFCYWIHEYFSDCYHDIVYKYYADCARVYAESSLLTEVGVAWAKTEQFIKGKAPQNEPFYVDDDLLSNNARTVSEHLKSTLNHLFQAIRLESCIIMEFWQIDDVMIVPQMISARFLEHFTKLMNSVTQFDPFFAMKAYGMCRAASQISKVPVNMLVDIPRQIWEQFMEKQKELLKEMKITRGKTSVLSVFKDFPQFCAKYAQMAEETEKPVLEQSLAEMSDEIVNWLTTEVAPKFSKKKRPRLIVLNISHLCDQLKTQPFVQHSEVLMESLKKKDELLEKNIRVLLKFIVSKSWVHASRFFDQICDWKEFSGLTDEMVTFQPSHTQEKFVELNERIEKRLTACVSECFAYMKKKIRHDGLRQVLRVGIVPFVKELFGEWDKMANDCYDMKLSVTPDKVAHLLSEHQ